MNTNDLAFILVTLVTLLAALACSIAWKVAYADGHEAGRLYERNRRNMRQIRGNQDQARPAATSPAAGQPPWKTAAFTSLISYGPPGGPSTMPIPSQRARRFPAAITSSSELVRLTDEYIAAMRADEGAWRRARGLELAQ